MPDLTEISDRVIARIKAYIDLKVSDAVNRVNNLETRLRDIPAGPKGERGESIKGEKGDPGERGADGIVGPRGEPGLAGEKGDRGPEGAQGAQGAQGAPGERGADGVRGEAGERGAPGERGTDGVRGEPGPAGAKGDPGPRGELGERGVDGAKGQDGESIKGDAGPRGEPGASGERGATGLQGERGLKGDAGADGRDAAELDILPSIDEAKSYRRGTWASHGGGLIRAARQTDPVKAGALIEAGWVVMVEGLSGPPVIEQGDDPREISVTARLTSGMKSASIFRIPMVIDRGVWREGAYEKGDHVSWDGSGWIAQRKTAAKPGSSPDDWRLSTKRGRDGKDAGEATPTRKIVTTR